MLNVNTLEDAQQHLENLYSRMFKTEMALHNLMAVIDFFIEQMVPEDQRESFIEKLKDYQTSQMDMLVERLSEASNEEPEQVDLEL